MTQNKYISELRRGFGNEMKAKIREEIKLHYSDKYVEYLEHKLIRKELDFRNCLNLLRDLADLQNGSPLVQDEEEWTKTMNQIYGFLEIHE